MQIDGQSHSFWLGPWDSSRIPRLLQSRLIGTPFLRRFCRWISVWSLKQVIEFSDGSAWLSAVHSEVTSKRFSRYDKYWFKPERLELNTDSESKIVSPEWGKHHPHWESKLQKIVTHSTFELKVCDFMLESARSVGHCFLFCSSQRRWDEKNAPQVIESRTLLECAWQVLAPHLVRFKNGQDSSWIWAPRNVPGDGLAGAACVLWGLGWKRCKLGGVCNGHGGDSAICSSKIHSTRLLILHPSGGNREFWPNPFRNDSFSATIHLKKQPRTHTHKCTLQIPSSKIVLSREIWDPL